MLATVMSRGPRVANPTPLPMVFPAVPQFYDHDRIDTTVELGSVEQWTIQNTSRELHVFHIHQTDFQVVAIDGEPVPFTGYQDTVSLPYAKKKKGKLVPGEVTVILPFTDPVILGKFGITVTSCSMPIRG